MPTEDERIDRRYEAEHDDDWTPHPEQARATAAEDELRRRVDRRLHRETIPWTPEQYAALEALSLEHGNAEVTMSRSTAGVLAHARFPEARCAIDVDGRILGFTLTAPTGVA